MSDQGNGVEPSTGVWELFASASMQGRRALVTGGGSGIGRSTAILLGRLGARVALTGRTEALLQQTAQAIVAEGGLTPVVAPADLRDTDQVDAMLDSVLAGIGGIDYLVNNAGGQFIAPAETVSMKGFRAVTRLNLDAVWYLTTRVADRAMLPAGYGKVVSITMTPRRGMPGMAHSSAARAAVENLTSTLAQEWAGRGIRLVALAPGIVHTTAWERYGLPADAVAAALPQDRLQSPEEIAGIIAFLLSPVGDSITGVTLVADGGYELLGPSTAIQAAMTGRGQTP